MTPDMPVPLEVVATLLFMVSGPIALIPLFSALTGGADRPLQVRIAIRAFMIATVTVSLAVFVAAGALARVGASPSSLVVAAGLILTLTALRTLFGRQDPGPPQGPVSLALATTPLAVPGLVSPLGVAVLVIFVSYFPEFSDKLTIYAIALAIMIANLGAMLIAHGFMRTVGMGPLLVLGAVFGVVQVALGIEMIRNGLRLG